MHAWQDRKAIEQFTVVTSFPEGNTTTTWNNLGFSFALVGDIVQALRSYKAAITLDPESKSAWVNLGGALKEVGKLKKPSFIILALKYAMQTCHLGIFRHS